MERYHHNCEDPLFADGKVLYDVLDKDMLWRGNGEQNMKEDYCKKRRLLNASASSAKTAMIQFGCVYFR